MVGCKQVIISEEQTRISKDQIKLQNYIQEMQIQPFFKIVESVNDEENRDIYIYNVGEECYINEVREITILYVNYESPAGKYNDLLIPIDYFGATQGLIGSDLVYKVIGLKNNYFTINLKENRDGIFNYVSRKTYVKITYTDKMNTKKTLYFNSKGSLLDKKDGEEYFDLYYSLQKIYSNLYNTSSFELFKLTPELIKNLLENSSLKTQLNNL